MKPHILDISPAELEKELQKRNIERYRAKQILHWICKQYVCAFSEMNNISKDMRELLEDTYSLFIPKIKHVTSSEEDTSKKFLLEAEDGKLIETILMFDEKRATLCVSCMIGCPLKCAFCATGSEIGFVRNLKASEILGQFLVALQYMKKEKLGERITNIVYMGMGEPFLNLKEVERSIEFFTSPDCFAMSKSRIAVSTAGAKANIADFINTWGVKLAVSLHFPTNEQRSKYMPINKQFPLEMLIQELRKIRLNHRDYITIEYLMLKEINDRKEDAGKLVKLLSSLKVKCNLIPYNPTENFHEQPSDETRINAFASLLRSKGIMVTVRRSFGVDIEGGCGQFALKKNQHP